MGSERNMRNEINIIETSESYMYLVKSKAIGYDLAEDWMLFWVFFIPIALGLSYISKENTLIYKGLFYIIFIFAMTFIRRNILGSFKYLLANFFIMLLVFLISVTLIEKITFLVPIFICFIISTKKRKSEVIEFYKIGMLLWSEFLMVICYFIAFNFNLIFMMKLINFSSINIAITWALYLYISRIASLMQWEGEFIKGYTKRMRNIKLSCITFISGVIIFFVLIFWRIGLYKLFDILTGKILVFLNSSPKLSEIKPEKVKTQAENAVVDSNSSLKNLGANGKNNHIITAIVNIVQFILYTALVLLALYLLVKLIIKLKNFYKGLELKKTYKKEKREFVFSLEDIKKEIKNRAESFKVEVDLPFNMSNRKKIRKLYRKLIKSYKTKEVIASEFNTPVEMEKKIRVLYQNNISEATAIYEKARYSEVVCSKEDVDKMKSFLR